MCKLVGRRQSGEGRARTESANVLFKGRAYCRIVVSSHSALIDSAFQKEKFFLLTIYGAWYVQQYERINEKVRHVLHAVC